MGLDSKILDTLSAEIEKAGDHMDDLATKLLAAGLSGDRAVRYVENARKAHADGVLWLARAAAGDAKAVDELRIVGARMALWSWAGAEAARREVLNAWKAWVYDATAALGDGAFRVFEVALRALVEAGIEQLVDADQ